MSFKELLESKHPTSWSEFEKGLIDENELAKKFFNDGRSFDLEGLKECMVRAYEYIDGVEDILCCLKKNNYEMHAFANYPVWYKLIEDKLKLSKYLSWTFCSCRTEVFVKYISGDGMQMVHASTSSALQVTRVNYN